MKILLQYKSSSKVKIIQDASELLHIVEATYALKPNSYTLQIYDEDFNEYIDLEDSSTIEDKSKIKIVGKESLVIACENLTSDSPKESPGLLIEEPEIKLSLFTKLQWPSSIELPVKKFSRPLLESLEKQEHLDWLKKSELVGHLASYAYQFKSYPIKAERVQICEALVQRYPHLKNDIGLGIGGWEIKLLNRLKKIRLSDSSVEIELNRQKRKSSTSNMPKRIKLNPTKGEVNWAPEHIQGENDSSQRIHKEVMAEESKKSLSFQNKSKLKYLMGITYSFRRCLINDKISVKDLKDQYPVFFQTEEQFDEFERLTSINIQATFFREVEKSARKLLKFFKEKKSDSLTELKRDIELILLHIEYNENVEMALGLLVLPALLKEPVQSFIEIVSPDAELQSVAPKIFSLGCVSSDKFCIVAENEVIGQTKDLITAVALTCSYYYTMNFSYPEELSATFKFLQKYFLKINAGTFPSKVIYLHSRIVSDIL